MPKILDKRIVIDYNSYNDAVTPVQFSSSLLRRLEATMITIDERQIQLQASATTKHEAIRLAGQLLVDKTVQAAKREGK